MWVDHVKVGLPDSVLMALGGALFFFSLADLPRKFHELEPQTLLVLRIT